MGFQVYLLRIDRSSTRSRMVYSCNGFGALLQILEERISQRFAFGLLKVICDRALDPQFYLQAMERVVILDCSENFDRVFYLVDFKAATILRFSKKH